MKGKHQAKMKRMEARESTRMAETNKSQCSPAEGEINKWGSEPGGKGSPNGLRSWGILGNLEAARKNVTRSGITEDGQKL
jgi:hypothetical protein